MHDMHEIDEMEANEMMSEIRRDQMKRDKGVYAMNWDEMRGHEMI